MLRKGPTSLLEVGPFVYSLKRVENLHVLRHSFGPVVCFIAYNAAVFIQSLGVCFVI